MDKKTNINCLFSPRRRQFAVPAYQRAYSWEVGKDSQEKQLERFIDDLKEQPKNIKYFLGHYLFEKDNDNEDKYWVIDGQQRLTTVVIFFSCLCRELLKRNKTLYKDVIDEIREDYLINRAIKKFETVEYDSNFFESVIIGDKKDIPNTKSKVRIEKAKDYFTSVLKSEKNIDTILHWKSLIEEAKVTTVPSRFD